MGFEEQLRPLVRAVWEQEKQKRRQARVVDGRPMRAYLSEADIYGLYGQSSRPTHLNVPALRAFIEELERIRSARGTKVVVQADVWYKFDEVRRALTGRDQRIWEVKAWDAFFHCLSAKGCPVERRIYVNTKDAQSGLVVLEAVVSALDTDRGRGVAEVKIAGPGAHRTDAVIVYCRDDAAVQTMLSLLGGIDAGHFQAGVPSGTRKVSPGVAVADQPSSLEVWETYSGGKLRPVAAVSFGDFYAKVIHMALNYPDTRLTPAQQPREVESLQELEQNVRDALKVCGVDPDKPHEIARSDAQLSSMLNTARAALTRRR